jgi:hypothetical protein
VTARSVCRLCCAPTRWGAKRIIELSRHRVARLIEVKGGFYIEGRQY